MLVLMVFSPGYKEKLLGLPEGVRTREVRFRPRIRQLRNRLNVHVARTSTHKEFEIETIRSEFPLKDTFKVECRTFDLSGASYRTCDALPSKSHHVWETVDPDSQRDLEIQYVDTGYWHEVSSVPVRGVERLSAAGSRRSRPVLCLLLFYRVIYAKHNILKTDRVKLKILRDREREQSAEHCERNLSKLNTFSEDFQDSLPCYRERK